MASIQPHKGQWRAFVRRRGVSKSAVFPTKREAQQWATKLEAEINAAHINGLLGKNAPTAHDYTFPELASRYRREVSAKKRGAQWEARRITALEDWFKDIKLVDIKQPQIVAWRDMRLKLVAGSTVLRDASLLHHMLRVARDEWRWIEHDPMKGIHWPDEAPPRHQRWGWREIKRVLRAKEGAGPKTRQVIEAFHISLRTGMRLQEVIASPQGFDPKRRVVVLQSTKTTGRVEIPIGRIACKLLAKQAPFTVNANEASTLFCVLVRQLLLDDLRFHDARATALTMLAKKVDVMTLAKISRHRDLKILLNTYYRATAEEIARKI